MTKTEVSNFRCDSCKHWWEACKCIDHKKIHFARSCFSCDEFTAHHAICSAFEPVEYYPALYDEWKALGGFDGWYPLYVEQWLNGHIPEFINIILAKKPKKGRDATDDIYMVPYDDFINCNVIRDDGIHYMFHKHIERCGKSVTGYAWFIDGDGILSQEDFE